MAKKVLIGLDKFHYSLLTTDDTANISYQTPVALRGAVTVAYNPNSEISTLFADDGPFDTAETIGEIELDVGIADITQEDVAALLGHTISGGVMEEDKEDDPVDCAFAFRAKRSNGGFSFFWLLKGKFSKPSMDHETKGDTVNFQTPVMNWKGVARVFDGLYKFSTRDDADNFSSSTGDTWFDAVFGLTADTTAPTFVSSDPSADSTSSAATADITITFSEPILTSSITAENFSILQGSSSTTIPITAFASLSATITLSQTALTASTSYDVLMTTGIKDETGNGLSGSATFRFTTTA